LLKRPSSSASTTSRTHAACWLAMAIYSGSSSSSSDSCRVEVHVMYMCYRRRYMRCFCQQRINHQPDTGSLLAC
jgi:hypothetical protein